MANLLFIVNEARGHLNPSLSLAQELQKQGHQIKFVGRPDGAECVQAQNFSYIEIGAKHFPKESFNDALKEIGSYSGISSLKLTIDLFKETSVCQLECLPSVFKSQKPDLLLIDQTFPAAASVADKYGIPFVTLCNAIDLSLDKSVPSPVMPIQYSKSTFGMIRNIISNFLNSLVIRPAMKIIHEYRRANNLSPYKKLADANSKILMLSQQTIDFEFPKPKPQQLYHVGPFATDGRIEEDNFPWERLEDADFIYASMGTIQNRLNGVFEMFADVCHELNIKLVMSGGGGADLEQRDFVGDPIAVNFAPQLKLLKKAKMVITHAGMNTAMETLANGLPMVAIPVTNDQPGVAARIAYSGAGKMIHVDKLSRENLKTAIEAVWSDTRFATNAKRLQRSIQEAGGSAKAATLVSNLLS